MSFWKEIITKLEQEIPVIMLYVIRSIGSSPGRKGFRMLVSQDGYIAGSIGGGIMEHKLVELSRNMHQNGFFTPFIKRQIHQDNIAQDKSGMICSGEQTIAFFYLKNEQLDLIKLIHKCEEENLSHQLRLSHTGIELITDSSENEKSITEINSPTDWQFIENVNKRPVLYIIGGGHVGLALSEIMSRLEFEITLIDDRENLNTIHQNEFVDHKISAAYDEIGSLIPSSNEIYIVLMSFGYATDKICIKQLINNSYKYFGVMGSKEKMRVLLAELEQEGFSRSVLDRMNTPIGLPIKSKTPMEIAISIAAEIIKVRRAEE